MVNAEGQGNETRKCFMHQVWIRIFKLSGALCCDASENSEGLRAEDLGSHVIRWCLESIAGLGFSFFAILAKCAGGGLSCVGVPLQWTFVVFKTWAEGSSCCCIEFLGCRFW